jgi:CHAT domain-containing protein
VIIETVEKNKAKSLRILIASNLKKKIRFSNKKKREKYFKIKKKLREVQIKLRAIKLESVEDKKYPKTENFKAISPTHEQKHQHRHYYRKFYQYSKEMLKLTSIQEIKNKDFYTKIITELADNSTILYPIYYEKRSTLEVLSLSKKKNLIEVKNYSTTIKHSPKFSKIRFFIKEIELFLQESNQKLIKKKIKSFNKRHLQIPHYILEMLFELDSKKRILKAKITYNSFMNKYRYSILLFTLDYLKEGILKAIPEGTKKIYFTPFGDLNILPLHALPIGKDKYLIDKYEIIYIPSLSVWSELKKSYTEKHKKSINNLYISQDYSKERSCYDEVIACKSLIKGKHKKQITSKEFKDSVHKKKFNILHLSVHGRANLKTPLDSALAFEKSKLSLLEIHGLNLHVNLLILSACEGNLLKTKGLDELLGFERAFIIAGATNIITTLDTVNIQRTKQLMTTLYTHMNNTLSFSEAFRQSAIESIDNNNMEWMLFRFMGV